MKINVTFVDTMERASYEHRADRCEGSIPVARIRKSRCAKYFRSYFFFFHFGALTEQLMVTLAIKDGGLSDYFFLFKNAIAR